MYSTNLAILLKALGLGKEDRFPYPDIIHLSVMKKEQLVMSDGALIRILFTGFVLSLGVLFACDSGRSGANTEELIGQWSSVRISYPNDPVFKNTRPDKVPGSARLRFRRNGHFVFTWEDTDISGRYHIDGQELILTGEKGGETTNCLFHLAGKQLTIEMDDGFKFEFEESKW